MRISIRRQLADSLTSGEYRLLARMNFRQKSVMREVLRKARRENVPYPIFVARAPEGSDLPPIIGWAIVKRDERLREQPVHFWVHGDYRRMGIGTQILRRVSRYAEAQDLRIKVFPHSLESRGFFTRNIDLVRPPKRRKAGRSRHIKAPPVPCLVAKMKARQSKKPRASRN